MPNPGQRRVNTLLAGPQRHSCVFGGSRSGKTTAFVRAVVMRALRAPGSRHAIVRFRYNAVRASIWLDTLPKVMRLCFPGVQVKDHLQEGYVSLPGGSEIWFLGLDEKERVEKVLGLEFATIFFNETSQIPYDSVLVALTRLAQKVDGLRQRVYCDLNPVGKTHWTYRLFVEGRDPVSKARRLDVDDWRSTSLNPAENASNLDPAYLATLQALPERTRRRFWDGAYVDELDGALWTLERLEACRIDPGDVPPLRRKVVAVDPSGAAGKESTRSDEIGIVAAGVTGDALSRGVVLDDWTCREGPAEWGRRAVALYDKHAADLIVAEANYGGAMVEMVIRAANQNVPVKLVSASRGKWLRAEPVAALYEGAEHGKGRVLHAGRFPELEDELTAFAASGYTGTRSPNRADALVFALSELMLGDYNGRGIVSESTPW